MLVAQAASAVKAPVDKKRQCWLQHLCALCMTCCAPAHQSHYEPSTTASNTASNAARLSSPLTCGFSPAHPARQSSPSPHRPLSHQPALCTLNRCNPFLLPPHRLDTHSNAPSERAATLTGSSSDLRCPHTCCPSPDRLWQDLRLPGPSLGTHPQRGRRPGCSSPCAQAPVGAAAGHLPLMQGAGGSGAVGSGLSPGGTAGSAVLPV